MKKKIKKIISHEGVRKYGTNTLWLLLEKVFRMAAGLFVGVWVARYLGPGKFGLFNYVQSFVGIFIAIATLGLDSIVIRELVKNEESRSKLLGTSFFLKIIGSVILFSILGIAIHFTSNDTYTNSLVFIVASSTLFQSFNVIDFYFQSKVLSKYVVYANIISLSISSVVKIILILKNASLIAFAWVVLFDSFVLALGLMYFFMKRVTSFKISRLVFDKVIAVSLLKDSWPLVLSSIIISIYMKIDQVMIKEMLNNEAVGQYAVAVKLSEMWYFIPAVIVNSFFPAIMNSRGYSLQIYYSRIQHLYDFMFWMAVFVAVIVSFSSSYLIDFLYGHQYIYSASILVIHVWAGVFMFVGLVCSKYLIAENYTKKALIRNFIGTIINIGCNFVLIPLYSGKGAAISTLLSLFFINYVYDFLDKDLRGQGYMKIKSLFPLHLIKNR